MAVLVAAFRISEPLEGCFVMPEDTENETVEQQPDPQEPVDDTTADDVTDDGPEPAEDAPEAPGDGEDPFDRKRYEAKIRKANQEAKSLRERLKRLEPLAEELQRIKDAEKTENERLNDQLARANEQVTKTRQRLVRSRVQALAGTATDDRAAFADPADAFAELDLDSYLDADGDIDEAAIEADLQALLERKPHWAKTAPPPEGPRRPAPDRTQASGAKQTRTLTPADEFAGWLKSQVTR